MSAGVATLNILSAGAARSVVERVIAGLQRDTGHQVQAEFGAVGAMRARLLEGTPADVIVLTASMIDELIAGGEVVAGSRIDLGSVATGVAVRAGTPLPEISTAAALRAHLAAASAVACPDPAIATAGKIVMQMLERLGMSAEVRHGMRFFPNGNAAMEWLAASSGQGEIGITQVTEILPIPGITYVGPLPEEFQARATYSVGLVARVPNADLARDFIGRLTDRAARPMLAAAGFELGD